MVGGAVLPAARKLLPDLHLGNHRNLATMAALLALSVTLVLDVAPLVICPSAGSGKPEDGDAL